MGVGLSDFKKGQVEKCGQNWENAQFPSALNENFNHLSLNGKNTPYFTILNPNTLSDFKIEPENPRNYVFEQL